MEQNITNRLIKFLRGVDNVDSRDTKPNVYLNGISSQIIFHVQQSGVPSDNVNNNDDDDNNSVISCCSDDDDMVLEEDVTEIISHEFTQSIIPPEALCVYYCIDEYGSFFRVHVNLNLVPAAMNVDEWIMIRNQIHEAHVSRSWIVFLLDNVD